MKKQLLIAAFAVVSAAGFAQPCSNLFFSEYLEGASNNKAIEIYNPTNATVNLTDYVIYRYNNGSPTPTDSLFPQGTLAAGAVFVAGNPSAVAAILSVSDTLHTITFFNGDDAMSLKHIPSNTVLDIIGIIGVDPGTNWPVGSGATSEFTLVRMIGVQEGTTNWTIGATQYDVSAQNTFTFLGNHTMTSCCAQTSASATSTDIDCFGNGNGAANVTASGGSSFTYLWLHDNSTSATISNLGAGTFACVVTNDCGNTDTAVVTISEPAALVTVIDSVLQPGCQQADGALGVNVSGGTPGYNTLWSNGQITALTTNLSAGTYSCYVSDNNGCMDTITFTLNNVTPQVVMLALTIPDTVCNNDAVMTLGGGSPAGGSWGGPGVTGNQFDPSQVTPGLTLINYFYTDSNNCAGSATDSVYVDICMGVENISATASWNVYPNPIGMGSAQDVVTIEFAGTQNNTSIALHDATGRLLQQHTVNGNRTTMNCNTLESGVYFLTLRDQNGTLLNRQVLVK